MAKKILLLSKDAFNMMSSWTDFLYITLLKNGTISLHNNVQDEYGSQWTPASRNIRTPSDFLLAFESMERLDSWEIEDIFPSMFSHLPNFTLLTKMFKDIEYEESEEEKDFFLFAFQFLLASRFPIPEKFEDAYAIFETIYKFTKEFFEKNNNFPVGVHKFCEVEMQFPKEVQKKYSDLKVFARQQLIKKHLGKAKWEIQHNHLHGYDFAMNSQRRKIQDFCTNFLRKNKELPVGIFEIEGVKVEFDIQ